LLIKSDEYGEVEIPFVADFILEIDFENKKIMMALPDGLLLVNKK
jgi:ribosomal 30S subunit maturation factor RimM